VPCYLFDRIESQTMRIRTHSAQARHPRAAVVAALVGLCLFGGSGCKRRVVLGPWSSAALADQSSSGYAIQVGVFASEDNAASLARLLEEKGLDAYFFAHESGFFKVQVGNFPSRAEAERTGRSLLQRGAVDEYFVVVRRASPPPSAAPPSGAAEEALRRSLVETARSFLDFPYTWGGASAEDGFDCSGLTMTVYRLNGITLPRTLGDQMNRGTPVNRALLKPGDLVFFATQTRGVASHVGIYIGNDLFIHAPGRNKTIREDALSGAYFAARYLGARAYL
jgi:gamma-D-glutamyl-L-lysine dipeptidyl-peptidase